MDAARDLSFVRCPELNPEIPWAWNCQSRFNDYTFMMDLSAPPSCHPFVSSLKEYSVSEISYNIKNMLEQTFDRIRVRGEISGAKMHTSGHLYCALKDAQAVLDAVCWRGVVSSLSFRPEDGMEVIGVGRITSYAGRSKYQLVIESLEIAGEGALLKTLEDRKKRLAAEGLFAQERKKTLPFLPRAIGVVTSPTGAVIRDILHRLRDRFPLPVLLWPVLVQGEGAAEQIAAAIRGFNQVPLQGPVRRPDLLIVARGGGSLEDLWAFNEEIVVRAAAESDIPLISAVGHETDTTLIDYASDWRAPTPTAAVERAVPVRADLYRMLRALESRSFVALQRAYEECVQRCDERVLRFEQLKIFYFERLSQSLRNLSARLRHPREQMILAEHQFRPLSDRLTLVGARFIRDHALRLAQWSALLESFSYHNTLKRGFCAVKNAHQELVSSKAEIKKRQETLTLLFHDGELAVLPIEEGGLSLKPSDRPKSKNPQKSSLQGTLW